MATLLNTGSSVIDLLKSKGLVKTNDVNERRAIAQKLGIQDYAGTEDQNKQLMDLVNSGKADALGGAPTGAAGGPAGAADLSATTGAAATTAPAAPGAPVSDRQSIIDKLTAAMTKKSEFNPTERQTALEADAGVPDLKDTATKLRDERATTLKLLDSLEKDIIGRTSNYLVSDAERNRITAAERAPLTSELGILDRNLSTAETAQTNAEKDVLAKLKGETDAAGQPAADLKSELDMRKTIEDLYPADGTKDKELTSDMKEYNFAVTQGYTGSFIDYAKGKANYRPPAAASTGSSEDVGLIADAIVSGNQPPALTGLYRNTAAVKAELQRRGYNLTAATEDWNATTQYLKTLNGAQQVRLRQAVNFAADSLDIVDSLSSQWSRSKFPLLNAGQLKLAKSGALGADAQSIATQLDSQISDLVSELATVYKGGGASTDEGLQLAAKQLSANWSEKQLKDAVTLVRKNLQIRINSINNSGVVGGTAGNPYAPQSAAPEADTYELDGTMYVLSDDGNYYPQ